MTTSLRPGCRQDYAPRQLGVQDGLVYDTGLRMAAQTSLRDTFVSSGTPGADNPAGNYAPRRVNFTERYGASDKLSGCNVNVWGSLTCEVAN